MPDRSEAENAIVRNLIRDPLGGFSHANLGNLERSSALSFQDFSPIERSDPRQKLLSQ